MNLSIKQKIIGIIAIIGTILILIFQGGLYPKNKDQDEPQITEPAQVLTPGIIKTNPNPLDQATLWALQPIEIIFSIPLENIPEFKYKIDPSFDHKVELSNDKKTLTITPTKPLPLGQSFTMGISGSTKIEGGKILGKDYTFHFKTIEYRGV